MLFLVELDHVKSGIMLTPEAVGIAACIPGARKGTVEVRPVLGLSGLPEVKS